MRKYIQCALVNRECSLGSKKRGIFSKSPQSIWMWFKFSSNNKFPLLNWLVWSFPIFNLWFFLLIFILYKLFPCSVFPFFEFDLLISVFYGPSTYCHGGVKCVFLGGREGTTKGLLMKNTSQWSENIVFIKKMSENVLGMMRGARAPVVVRFGGVNWRGVSPRVGLWKTWINRFKSIFIMEISGKCLRNDNMYHLGPWGSHILPRWHELLGLTFSTA